MATIMIVDDDTDISRANRMEFESRGHTVLESHSAAEARELLRDHQPDIAVLDVIMETRTAGLEPLQEYDL